MREEMRFTVSLSLLILGSVDWILYQLQIVKPSFRGEGCGHQCESFASMSSSDVKESDRPKWNAKQEGIPRFLLDSLLSGSPGNLPGLGPLCEPSPASVRPSSIINICVDFFAQLCCTTIHYFI